MISSGVPPVVVTDGEQRAALAVVRSLGRAGYPVHVCASRTPSLAGASRYAASETRVPDPLATPDRYAEAVGDRVARTGAAVLLPVTEGSLLAVLPRPALLGDVRIPWPQGERLACICDKARVLEKASAIGLRVPAQRLLNGRAELSVRPETNLSYPVVLKPTRSVADTGVGDRRMELGVSYAGSPEELRSRVDALPEEAFPLLLQQRIRGPGIGVFLLLWDGELLATFAHRRIREKPPSGGVSVYRESVAADPELVARSRRLLEAFDWEGVAMVEYKVEETSGQPYLMEVNGRFWGSLQLAVDAGVDFPALLVAAALGGRPEPVRSYRTGVRSRWWWGDVDHLALRWLRSSDELALPTNAPGRWRALGDFLLLWRPGDRSEILRLSDPGPFVHESARWLRQAFRRV